MQTGLSKNWTRVIVSISYDSNHYTMSASNLCKSTIGLFMSSIYGLKEKQDSKDKIKWVGFFCDHMSEFSSPDMNQLIFLCCTLGSRLYWYTYIFRLVVVLRQFAISLQKVCRIVSVVLLLFVTLDCSNKNVILLQAAGDG